MFGFKKIFDMELGCSNLESDTDATVQYKHSEDKRMNNILNILFTSGISAEIKTRKSIDNISLQYFTSKLENGYGISEKYSSAAIIKCAEDAGIPVSIIKHTKSKSKIDILESESKQDCDKMESDEMKDYVMKKHRDGWVIEKFVGFEDDEMVIPGSYKNERIVAIGKNAFSGCRIIKRVIISEGISRIDCGAFSGCNSLEEIHFPNTLFSIGDSDTYTPDHGVFAYTKLKDVKLPTNVGFVGSYSFAYCRNLSNVEMSDNIRELNEGVFYKCSLLSEINMPVQLHEIKSNAFKGCDAMVDIYLPKTTTKIGADAFYCKNLKTIYIPPSVESIGWKYGKIHNVFSYECELTIYCSPGSVALDYARSHGIKYARADFD